MTQTLEKRIQEIVVEFYKDFVTLHYDATHPNETSKPSYFNGDPTGYFDENFVKPIDVAESLAESLHSLALESIEACRVENDRRGTHLTTEPCRCEDCCYQLGKNAAITEAEEKAKEYLKT